MAITIDPKKKILLDADVIIHFIKGEQIGILHTIFPNKLFLLDIVLSEVFKGSIRIQVENLLNFKFVQEITFKTDFIVLAEYARLKKQYGSGESACMAYCKYHRDILASSNLKDIKAYCEENNIQYLTTMDFIHQAYVKEILNEGDCDYFIYNVKIKGSKLPCNTIKEFISSKGNQ